MIVGDRPRYIYFRLSVCEFIPARLRPPLIAPGCVTGAPIGSCIPDTLPDIAPPSALPCAIRSARASRGNKLTNSLFISGQHAQHNLDEEGITRRVCPRSCSHVSNTKNFRKNFSGIRPGRKPNETLLSFSPTEPITSASFARSPLKKPSDKRERILIISKPPCVVK